MWKEAVVVKFKILCQYMPGGTEKIHERTQNSWSPVLDVNSGHPEYKAGVLTT
jgi:hypothetical protein